ncbi:MAG: hypothetical protein ACKOPM_15385 [Novosphingobium sp.]
MAFHNVLIAALALLAVAAAPPQFLREQKTVTVNGKPEIWQLVWDGRPKPICGPQDVETAVTCPCTGFAYGEMGKLSLVRKVGGKVIDRLALGPFFSDLPESNSQGLAAMQWRPMAPGDFDRAADGAGGPAFLAEVARRPGQRVMQTADYDRDGNASEFLVQVSAGPCGHTDYMLFGVSKARPKLHAFGSSDHPGDVLVMPGSAWQALLTSRGTARVTAWPCGDHASDVRQELVLSARAGAIRVRQKTWTCPENGEAERLLKEVVL